MGFCPMGLFPAHRMTDIPIVIKVVLPMNMFTPAVIKYVQAYPVNILNIYSIKKTNLYLIL